MNYTKSLNVSIAFVFLLLIAYSTGFTRSRNNWQSLVYELNDSKSKPESQTAAELWTELLKIKPRESWFCHPHCGLKHQKEGWVTLGPVSLTCSYSCYLKIKAIQLYIDIHFEIYITLVSRQGRGHGDKTLPCAKFKRPWEVSRTW